MATVLIGTAIGATSAVRVTAVRPRAGAGARAFAFGASNAASPSRVAGRGRRGTVRVAVRASLSLETVREEKPEARVVSEDAHASASRGEALKQVQTRPSNRLPPWRKISPTWSAFALFEVCRASTLTVRHPRLPSFHAADYTPRSSSVSRPSRWLSLVRLRSRRDTERSAVEPPVGAFVRARFRETREPSAKSFRAKISESSVLTYRSRPPPHHAGASLAAAKAKSAVAVAGPIPFLPFTHNQILRAVNLGSLPAWFSMVLLPRWRHTKTITLAVAVAYSLLYATLACVLFSESVLSLDFKALTTAEGVTKVFSDSTAVLAGWAHFIVFDLFTARFFLQDSARVGIPHLAVVPCILGCMFFGPVGLLTYVLVKTIYRTIRDKEGGAVKTYSF